MVGLQTTLLAHQRLQLPPRLFSGVCSSRPRVQSALFCTARQHPRFAVIRSRRSGGLLAACRQMISDCTSQPASQVWIFGFGSLVHHPNFEFSQRVEGYVKGWRRVFHQGSTDHRGTPEAPGRTVTLIQEPDCITWGAAYHLAGTPEQQAETLKYLEWREKQYDLRYKTNVFGKDGSVLVEDALVYIATPNRTANVNWLGHAPLQELAHQIAHAHGPSGPNNEYLYKLAEAMRRMDVNDPELFELEAAVREICSHKHEMDSVLQP